MCKTKGWLCLTNGQKNGREKVRVVGLGAYDVLHIASVRPWCHHWHFLRIKTTTRRMRGRQAFLRITFSGKTWTSIAVLSNLHAPRRSSSRWMQPLSTIRIMQSYWVVFREAVCGSRMKVALPANEVRKKKQNANHNWNLAQPAR